jgi:hypothetical protein
MSGPRAKVLIVTPCYPGMTTYRYTEALMKAQLFCVAKRIHCELYIAARMTLLEYARAWLAEKFLRSDATHMMCIDDDLGFEPTAIARMVDHDKDIVAGVYPVKTIPIYYPYEPLGPPGPDGLQLAKSVPGGFMLIKRHVMEHLAGTVERFNVEHNNEAMSCPDLYSMVNRNAAKHGEDVMFCERAIAAGFQIHVDPAIGFVHVGMFEWGGQLSHQLEREQLEAEIAADAADEKPRIVLDPNVGKVRPVAAGINGALHR